jgi:hypothetical protein
VYLCAYVFASNHDFVTPACVHCAFARGTMLAIVRVYCVRACLLTTKRARSQGCVQIKFSATKWACK